METKEKSIVIEQKEFFFFEIMCKYCGRAHGMWKPIREQRKKLNIAIRAFDTKKVKELLRDRLPNPECPDFVFSQKDLSIRTANKLKDGSSKNKMIHCIHSVLGRDESDSESEPEEEKKSNSESTSVTSMLNSKSCRHMETKKEENKGIQSSKVLVIEWSIPPNKTSKHIVQCLSYPIDRQKIFKVTQFDRFDDDFVQEIMDLKENETTAFYTLGDPDYDGWYFYCLPVQ